MEAPYTEVVCGSGGFKWVEGEVVEGAVDIVADQPAGGAAHDHVGGEVLLGEDTAEADAGGEAVYRSAGKPAGIFVTKNRSHGPGGGGVVGGKRGVEWTGAEEVAFGVVDGRAITEGDELDGLAENVTVGEGFPGEQSGLMGLRSVV